ncbi:MAG: hypothetical protein M3O32_21325, partial [Actinomycetota bacterium]|nr:hypothetical protein [Actinomycetota bacterium]
MAAATATVAGFVAIPSASASITSVTPTGTFHATSSVQIAVTKDTNHVYPPQQSNMTLTRTGAAYDHWTVSTDPPPPPSPPNLPSTAVYGTFGFANDANGTAVYNPDNPATSTDGPANPGVYDITIDDGTGTPAGPPKQTDTCTQCFTLLPGSPALGLSSVSPNALSQGGSSNITLTGTDFARGITVEVMTPDGSGVDGTINANLNPLNSNGSNTKTPLMTTTTALRRISIPANAPTGARDVRLRGVDGEIGLCHACFTIQGVPLTSVVPTAGTNDPNFSAPGTSSPYHHVVFNGSGAVGTPSLVFEGASAGSASRSDLTVPPVTSSVSNSGSGPVAADYDLRNAAPGIYRPTVTQSNQTVNQCGCLFTVGQPNPASVDNHGMDSDPNTQGDQNSQAQGTTLTYAVTGKNFSKGVKLLATGTGVTNTKVVFTDATHISADW